MEKSYEKQRCGDCAISIPTGKDFYIQKDECDKQVDIKIEQTDFTLIWGYVTDSCRCSVEDALVTLIEYDKDKNRKKHICRTYTDCNGYYQFNIKKRSDCKYRVIASPSCPNRRHEKEGLDEFSQSESEN